MASNPENPQARRSALCCVLLLVGCGATALEVARTNPGYPGYPTAEVPRSRVLEPGFDPASLTSTAAKTTRATTAAPSDAVVYQCPMHPEVKRDAPGRCPICGMKLESHSVDHQAEHSAH